MTLRYDKTANSAVLLFFARVMGVNDADLTATATAVLQKATLLYGGANVLPFAVHEDVWNNRGKGEDWSIYGNGRIEDSFGELIPGNWGTVDIGSENNSVDDMGAQIVEGLRQSDLDALYADARIKTKEYIDSTKPWLSQADTGLSSGLMHSVRAVHGLKRLVPIYDYVAGTGDNTDFRVIRWGVVRVLDSSWNGTNDTRVTIRKAHTYEYDKLRAQPDLSNSTNIVEGAYSTPALVQ